MPNLDELNPEGLEVYDVVIELGRLGGSTTVGAIAETTWFPLPEVQRVLDQLAPSYVEVGGAGPDGTAEGRAR